MKFNKFYLFTSIFFGLRMLTNNIFHYLKSLIVLMHSEITKIEIKAKTSLLALKTKQDAKSP